MSEGSPRGRVRSVLGTVRFRITAIATLAVAVVLILAGAGLVTLQRGTLTENLEEGLSAEAGELGSLLGAGVPPEDMARGLQVDDDAFAQIVSQGEVVALLGNDAPDVASTSAVVPVDTAAGVSEAQRLHTVELDGESYRVLTRPVGSPSEGGAVWILVASPLDDVDESADALIASLTLAIPAVVVVLGALIWWLVGRTLRPVEAIRARAAEIGGDALDLRVPEPAGDDEVARLARTMNGMLDRIEESNRRQERFVADASHELRTPLTRMRAEIEVDIDHPETADRAATERSVLDEVVALQSLVEDLLLLSRSGSAGAARHVPVALDELVREEVAYGRGWRAGITIDDGAVAEVSVSGNPEHLRRVVRNLLDNALRHAGSHVVVTLAVVGGDAVLEVVDDGPGIAVQDREQVFERFTRLDEARHQDGGGAGLGLAIAREIVERHGGTVEVVGGNELEGGDEGARFRVVLPVRCSR